MKNPFLKSDGGAQYLTSECSINKLRLAKLPVYGVDDAAEGLTVKEIFSAGLVIDEIKKNADRLHIDVTACHEKKLPRVLAKKADDENDKDAAALARQIIMKFGGRLGLLLLTLRLGEDENRAERTDWTAEHWDYWAHIRDIILVGGLASGTFGELMRQRVNEVFALKGVEPYNILLYDNASQVAVLGCAGLIKKENGVFVVMDFGQTGIKRSCAVKCDGEVVDVKIFEPYPSKYMDWEIGDEQEKLRQAQALHRYLVRAVENTFTESKHAAKAAVGGEVVISIASYTMGGALNSARGGYAKLCLLGSNYADILAEELSGRLRRDITVKLVHDGTAIALNFKGRKNTVCLSVGSYFGVGFPETRTE